MPSNISKHFLHCRKVLQQKSLTGNALSGWSCILSHSRLNHCVAVCGILMVYTHYFTSDNNSAGAQGVFNCALWFVRLAADVVIWAFFFFLFYSHRSILHSDCECGHVVHLPKKSLHSWGFIFVLIMTQSPAGFHWHPIRCSFDFQKMTKFYFSQWILYEHVIY